MEIRLDFNLGSRWTVVANPTSMEVPMPAEPPIACSLSATELSLRLAEMAALGRAALVDAVANTTRAELRFAARAGVRDRVSAIVAAESRCCAFLTMRVTDERDAVVLTIDAPEGADLVLGELVDAFRGSSSAQRPG
jgi:hypothetical protein